MQEGIIAKLAGNNPVYQKSDSLLEKISAIGSWILETTLEELHQPKVQEKLAQETKHIPSTSKNQKRILCDPLLVKGISALTQFQYFKHTHTLKIVELNASRPFASEVSNYNFELYLLAIEVLTFLLLL